jgi:hypothetical protein
LLEYDGKLMAFSLTVDKLEADGTIRVRHVFFGDTLEECEHLRDEHAAGCQAFGPALKRGHKGVIEVAEEVDEIPEWTEDDED